MFSLAHFVFPFYETRDTKRTDFPIMFSSIQIKSFRMPVYHIKEKSTSYKTCRFLVGVAGFEPAASWTRTMRDTKLRHTPKCHIIINISRTNVKCEMHDRTWTNVGVQYILDK